MKRFLLLGDSITEQALDFDNGGWALRLQSIYRRKVDFFDRGFSGYNTRWVLKYLSDDKNEKRVLPFPSFDLAVIFLGANDAVEKGDYHHVPLDEYKQNLKELCFRVRSPRVIVVTPPPYDAEKYKRVMNYPVSLREDERTKQYAVAAQEVAAEFSSSSSSSQPIKVVCANINDEFRRQLPYPKWVDAMSDGLHLAADGNRIVAETLLKVIEKEFPEVSPEKLDLLLPVHRVFDPENKVEYEPQTEEEKEIMEKFAAAKKQ